MEGRLLIRDCAVWQAGGAVDDRSVLIEGETIAAVDAASKLPARPGDWVADARGRLVTPGLFGDGEAEATGAAQHQLRVANALRHGITGVVSGGGPALGARVIAPSGASGADGAALQQASFGVPFGKVEPGYAADLVLWDAVPGTGFTLTLGKPVGALVAWVIVAGRVVVREGQLVGADYLALATAARAR